MKKWAPILLTVILSFFTSPIFAQTTQCSGSDCPTISDPAVVYKTDLSLAYLGEIFGDVGNVIHGNSGQMFGKLMYPFTTGVLIACATFLGMTSLSIIFKSATQGSFMGQQSKLHYLALRVALGTGLLLPNPSTGYTVLQVSVAQFIVWGVSLADQTWRYGLEYIQNGGDFWRPPSGQEGTSTVNNSGQTQSNTWSLTTQDAVAILGNPSGVQNGYAMGQMILANLVCMNRSTMLLPTTPVNTSTDSSYVSGASTVPYSAYTNWDQFRYDFPGGKDTPGEDGSSCGYISWSQIQGANCSKSADNADVDDSNNHCGMARLAIYQMIEDLQPAAMQYACQYDAGSATCSGTTNDGSLTESMANALFGAAVDFANLIMPLTVNMQNDAYQKAKQFIPQAEAEGWVMAGRYYWDLGRIEDAVERSSSLSNYVVPAAGMKRYDGDNKDINKAVDGVLQATVDNTKATPPVRGYISDAFFLLFPESQMTPGQDPSNGGGSNSSSADKTVVNDWNDYANGVSADPSSWLLLATNLPGLAQDGAKDAIAHVKDGFNWGLQQVMSLMNYYEQAFSSLATSDILNHNSNAQSGTLGFDVDPVVILHKVGMKSLDVAGDLWVGVVVMVMTLSAAMVICNSSVNFMQLVQMFMSWVQPLFILVAGMLFQVGIMFGIFLAYYPFMVYLCAVLGCFILFIEMMVAAPIVALGMTHQEGHDIFGAAKQSMLLWLQGFLMPCLTVIGLLTGMILSMVALRILIYAFIGFTDDLFYNIHAGQAPLSGQSTGTVWHSIGIVSNRIASESGITGWIMGMLIFPMILVMFANFAYVITTQCYSLIHRLPAYVMRWIGLHPDHSPVPQMMGEIYQAVNDKIGGMKGVMERTGLGNESLSLASSHAQRGLAQKAEEKKQKKEEDEKKQKQVSVEAKD